MKKPIVILMIVLFAAGLACADTLHGGELRKGNLTFTLRSRDESGKPVYEQLEISSDKIGIVVVDMWASQGENYPDAVVRLDYLAPIINMILSAARDLGVTVIQAPSSSTHLYTGTGMYQRGTSIADYPLPESNGWYPDFDENVIPGPPGEHQSQVPPGVTLASGHFSHDSIAVHPDLIMDDDYDLMIRAGEEISWPYQYGAVGQQDLWDLIQSRGLTHLFYVGCHTNICIIDREFGVVHMNRTGGVKTVLFRDAVEAYTVNGRDWGGNTDDSYTPDTGNQKVVELLEQYIAPSASFLPLLKNCGKWLYYCRVMEEPNLLCYWRMNGDNSAANPYWCILDQKRIQCAWNGESSSENNVTVGVAGAIAGDDDPAALFDGSRAISVGPIYRDKLPTGSPLICLSDESFSVEAWVLLADPAPSAPQWILTHDDGTPDSEGNRDFMLGVTADKHFIFGTRNMASKALSNTVVSQADIDKQRWFHVVGVQDTGSGKVRLYVNGVMESEIALAGEPVSTTSTLQIGSRGLTDADSRGYLPNCGFEIFTGAIDEVAIYQDALKNNNVRSHYRAGISGDFK